MNAPEAPRVTVQRDGHLLLIGIDRAAKRNAWDLRTISEVGAAYDRLAADDEVRVGVLFGRGDHFTAGLDLAEVLPAVQQHGPQVITGGGTYDPFGVWLPQVPKPVVMAVQGIAFTIAIELALACDIVVAADDVRFRQLEVGRGILPFGGATLRAPAQLGWGNAMRFLLTGEEFGAELALRIGLVQEVVPPGQQLERACEIARLIARQAPLGVRATLANARLARTPPEPAVAHLAGLLPAVMDSADAAEGVRSFIERRTAVPLTLPRQGARRGSRPTPRPAASYGATSRGRATEAGPAARRPGSCRRRAPGRPRPSPAARRS